MAERGNGLRPPQSYHIAYERTRTEEDRFAVLGGETEAIADTLDAAWSATWTLADALRSAVELSRLSGVWPTDGGLSSRNTPIKASRGP